MTGDNGLAGRRVLIVDDHEPHRTLLANYLGALGCTCDTAGGGREALAKMRERPHDLVLLDLRMDDLDGMEVLTRAQRQGIIDRCVMMSAEGTISHAVEAIRLGASDFLVKPFELEQLHDVAGRVMGGPLVGTSDGRDPRLYWRDEHVPQMVGEHPALLEVFLVLERIAHTDCTVLVTGESGTGKELVARAIHHASARSQKRFVAVNCGAIAETLIESELFGHAKGAFSGATQAREGRFAVADHGTLFLDEIGEMSLSVQVKFLRVLQEREFVPVGETRPRKCDVRIIAATNKNLEKMAESGAFRSDLFYRLNLIPVHLPSLRERRTDIPRLAQHFVDRLRQRRDIEVRGFTDEALTVMTDYAWPGNVRELENAVERMALLHQGRGLLTRSDLPRNIRGEPRPQARSTVSPKPRGTRLTDTSANATPTEPFEPPTPTRGALLGLSGTTTKPVGALAVTAPRPATPAAASNAPRAPAAPGDFVLPEEGIALREAVEKFEMSLIEQALRRTGGNKNQASILLGMNRTTLVEKLRKRRRKSVGKR